jgi:hypothetical protein
MFTALLLAACSTHPLSEVPIVGGSEEARELVERELELFAEAILPETIELSEIAFVSLREGIQGRYRLTSRRVLLHEGLSLENVPSVLRHELCHALDFQTDLARPPHEALEAYAERLYDPEHGALPRDWPARERRSEALANLCEIGPTLASALVTPCHGEPPLLSELGAFAQAQIWRGVEALVPLPAEPPVSFVAGDFERFSLRPSKEPDLIRLELSDTEGWDTAYALDLYTAERLGSGWDLDLASEEVEEVPPHYALEEVHPFRAAGGPQQALVAGLFELEAFGFGSADAPRERLLWSAGDGWAALPLCVPGDWLEGEPGHWDIFAADDQVWYAEGDGQRVWWSPVVGQED